MYTICQAVLPQNHFPISRTHSRLLKKSKEFLSTLRHNSNQNTEGLCRHCFSRIANIDLTNTPWNPLQADVSRMRIFVGLSFQCQNPYHFPTPCRYSPHGWLDHKTVSGSNSKLETQSIWATPQVIYVKVKMAGNIAIDPSLVCLPCTFFFLHPMQKWHGEYLGTEDRWSWRRIGCGILRRCLLRQSWNRQWLAPC